MGLCLGGGVMSEFVRSALEAQLNANLRENIEAVRSAGFEVEGLVDGEAPLTLRVRAAQLALPGPGAETPKAEKPKAEGRKPKAETEEEKKAKKAAYMKEYWAKKKAAGKA